MFPNERIMESSEEWRVRKERVGGQLWKENQVTWKIYLFFFLLPSVQIPDALP